MTNEFVTTSEPPDVIPAKTGIHVKAAAVIIFNHKRGQLDFAFAGLPKFTKTESELTTIADKWLYFVKNAGSLEYVPAAMAEPELRQAFAIAN